MTATKVERDLRQVDALAADGRIVQIRRVLPEDAGALLALYQRESDESLRLRFFGSGRGFLRREVERLVRAPGPDHAALVADDDGVPVGVACYEREPGGDFMDTMAEARMLVQRAVEEPPRRVVVGVDGSPAGDAALEWALCETEVAGAELLVCHAYTPEHIVRPLPGGAVGTLGQQRARQRLQTAVARAVRRLGWRSVHGELRLGDPATVLLAAADGAGTLVVGSHGYFGQTSRLLGSTALRVAAHAACPAVVVRPLLTGPRGPFTGHVVVGVDDSEPAHAAVEFGFRYAALHDLPLAAVHVAAGWPGDFWTDDELLQTYFAAEPPAQTRLAVEVEPWHHRFPEVPVKRAVYGGDPVPGLLRAAGGARLLVVGDRRRDSLRRLLLGSVSQGVVGHAACPVAVVHADR